jgi:hypothetical protein
MYDYNRYHNHITIGTILSNIRLGRACETPSATARVASADTFIVLSSAVSAAASQLPPLPA